MKTSLPLFALSAITFAACSSAPPYAALPIEDDAEETSDVVIADEALWDVIRVGRSGAERVAGTNQLRVMVPVRNIDDEPVLVLVQVTFKDGTGMPIDDASNQQVKILGPGSTTPMTFTSKSDLAQRWTMNISWNR